jgi:hypothetical protein
MTVLLASLFVPFLSKVQICYFMMAPGERKRGREIRTVGGSATKSSNVSSKRRTSGRVAE